MSSGISFDPAQDKLRSLRSLPVTSILLLLVPDHSPALVAQARTVPDVGPSGRRVRAELRMTWLAKWGFGTSTLSSID